MPYHHLTPIERGQIHALLNRGESRAAIARSLGRNRSSIGRELARNGAPEKDYCPERAQKRYREMRKECVRTKRLDYPPLRHYLFVEGSRAWSPEQVAGRLPLEYPHDPRMRISYETLYQALYTDERLSPLIHVLRQARPKRRIRGQGKSACGTSNTSSKASSSAPA